MSALEWQADSAELGASSLYGGLILQAVAGIPLPVPGAHTQFLRKSVVYHL